MRNNIGVDIASLGTRSHFRRYEDYRANVTRQFFLEVMPSRVRMKQ